MFSIYFINLRKKLLHLLKLKSLKNFYCKLQIKNMSYLHNMSYIKNSLDIQTMFWVDGK